MADQCGLGRTSADHRPVFAGWYAGRIEGRAVASSVKYARPFNIEVYGAVWPHRRFQSASLAVMQRRRFAKFGILYEMMTLKIRYHNSFS